MESELKKIINLKYNLSDEEVNEKFNSFITIEKIR